MKRRYFYISPVKKYIAAGIDFFGFWLPIKKKEMPTCPKKILVVRVDHIGDVVLAIPFFKSLRNAFPNAKITALLGPWVYGLLEDEPFIDQIIYWNNGWFDRGKNERKEKAKLQQILPEKFDITFELRGFAPNIIALKRINSGYIIGYGTTGLGWLLDKEVEYRWDENLHEVEHNLDLLRSLNISISDYLPCLTPKAYPIFSDLRNAFFDSSFLVGIHPFSGNAAKNRDIGFWENLLIYLQERYKYLEPVFFMIGSEREKSNLEILCKQAKRAINTGGMFDLSQLKYFLSKLNLFVGVDSGIAHISAAVGAPTVAFMSLINNWKKWHPLGRNVKVFLLNETFSMSEIEKLNVRC